MKPDDDQLLAHIRSDVQMLIQRRDSLKAVVRNYNSLINQNMKIIEQIQEREAAMLGYLTGETTLVNYGLTLLLLTAAVSGYLIGKILEDAFK